MDERPNPLGAVVAKALQDEAFKQQLIADPAAVLAAEGVAFPEGLSLKVVADTESVRHLVLPAMSDSELRDADLEQIAAAGSGCYAVELCRFLGSEQ